MAHTSASEIQLPQSKESSCHNRLGGTDTPSSRLLEGLEVRQAVIHDLSDVLVTTVIELQVPPVVAELRTAAAVLQKRHALLRSALRREEGQILFDSALGGTVDVMEYTGGIEFAADAELHQPLTDSCGWRLGICGKYVLLSYHHSFLDGTSVMVVLRELFSILGQTDLHVDDAQQRTTLPHSAQACLSNLPQCEPGADITGTVCAKTPVVPLVAQLAPPIERRTRQIWRRMNPSAAKTLRACCRREDTTVTGAVGAAAVRSFCRVFASKGTIGVRTFFNIRDECQMPPCTLGAYYSHALLMLEDDGTFWDTARSYRTKISDSIRCRRHLQPAMSPPDAIDEQRLAFAAQLATDDGSAGPCAIAISNRGPWAFPLESAYQVKSVHFAQAKAKIPKASYLVLNACSVDDVLCLTVVYDHPSCEVAAAGTFADEVVDQLIAASSNLPDSKIDSNAQDGVIGGNLASHQMAGA